MTENFYKTKNYETDNSHFGGNIYLSDFETDYPVRMADIAARIMSDKRFDEQCRKASENKNRKKKIQEGK